MKTILYSSFILLLLLIDTTLGAQNVQHGTLNEYSRMNYSICYAKVNEIDSIPFLAVDGLKNNLISEELVFALDLDFDHSIIEIEEGVFIEFTISLEPAYINNIEFDELQIMPLLLISRQMGIEFYGMVDR